jgi:hypothetical protein
VRRRSRRGGWPPRLARFREADWIGDPLTDTELNTYGRRCAMHPHLPPLEQRPLDAGELAGIARSRWLWARWEHADSAGLPGAIDYFVDWVQGPPQGERSTPLA